MGLIPSGNSHVKWDNSNGAADYLQLVKSGGAIVGWIDSNGIPQGSLASSGSSSAFSGITGGTNTNALVIGSGGSLSASGTGSIIATNGSAAFSSYIDVVQQFGVIADCKWVVDAVFSTSATSCGSATVPAGTCVTITATDPPFACPNGVYPCSSGGDVGKMAFGTYHCNDSNPGACIVTFTDGTIVKVIDATHAQLSKAVSHSSTNSASEGSNFAWGSAGNGAKLQAASAFMVANPGTALSLPCGSNGGGAGTGGAGAIMFDSTPFGIGTHAFPVGIYGCANGGTTLIPNSSTFTNGFLVSTYEIGASHLQPGSQDQFENLFFWGLGADTGVNESHNVLSFGGAALNNVNLQGWLWNTTNSFNITGLNCVNNCTLINSGSYCGGNFPCALNAGFFSTTMVGGSCGGSNSPGMTITTSQVPGSSVIIKGAYLYLNTLSGYGVIVNATNPVILEGNNIAGISVINSGPVILKGNYIDYFFSSVPNLISNAGGTISIEGNVFHSPADSLLSQSSGTLIDNCGNQGMTGSITVTGGIITGPCSNAPGNPWGTNTNCNSSASPAACGSAAQGSVAVAAGSTTLQVNTATITANSQVLLVEDASLGTKLGVTCNGTPSVQPLTVTARAPGVSFTFSNTSPSANPRCVSYYILN